LSVRRVAAGIGALLVGIVGIYAFRTVMGISHLTGSSPGEVLGCLTKLKCDSALAGTTQRINIALYGYGGAGHDGAYLTDSIMVVSIQPQPDGQPARVAEISVPRDWYVPIDAGNGRTGYGRINEAYADGMNQGPISATQYRGDPHGGGKIADANLSSLLGIHIDHFVGVDFHAFQAAVDAVGGVDVNVPDSFTDNQYPHGECGRGDCAVMTVHFNAGPQHMDGARALIFSRSRHAVDNAVEGTDFARSRRQQLVLQALKSKVLSVGGIGHLPDLLGALGDHVITDLSFQDDAAIYDLIKGTDSKSFEHISVDDTNFLYECGYPARCSAAYLYAHDKSYASLQRFIKNSFPSTDAVREHAPITVMDGSGYGQGGSARWSKLLGMVGFSATDGSAGRTTAATRVIDSSGGRDSKTAQWLAAYFGTSVERPKTAAGTSGSTGPVPAGSGVTVILGQDEERSFTGNAQSSSTGGVQGAYSGSAVSGSATSVPTPRRATPRPSAPPTSSPPPPPPTLTPCPIVLRCN
jgi:LCP family protein required for cell wall assembly